MTELATLVTTDVEELTNVVLPVVTGVVLATDVAVAVTPPGGSRCRTKPRLNGLPKICDPTASPLVPERSDMPNRIPGSGIEGVSSVLQVFVPLS